jgi:hypothetical protein
MNAWLKQKLGKWIGIDRLDGTQFEQHMRLLELERQVSALSVKPKRDARGRFEK